MRNEGSFSIPLKYFDVVRRTNTILDVLLDGDPMLSGPWTRFIQFSKLNEMPPKKPHMVREEIGKSSGNIQARFFIARSWIDSLEMTSKHRKNRIELLKTWSSRTPCKALVRSSK